MPSLLGTTAVAPEFVVNLVLTLPSLTMAVSSFFIGALADKVGRVRILCISLTVFALAGVTGFFLDNIYSHRLSSAPRW